MHKPRSWSEWFYHHVRRDVFVLRPQFNPEWRD